MVYFSVKNVQVQLIGYAIRIDIYSHDVLFLLLVLYFVICFITIIQFKSEFVCANLCAV